MVIDEALRGRIYGWAFRLLQNHHDALDATQEVLVRALRHTNGEVEQPAAWLRRVTVNHCVDLRRRHRPNVEFTETVDGDMRPDQSACNRELSNAVLGGMQGLSEQQRTVLMAKVYDQETFAAIAGAMNLSIPTVKTHYLRALRGMRDVLRGFAENEA